MKLKGSKRIKIECLNCKSVSEPFRVTLFEYDGEDQLGFMWQDKDFPIGWEIPDDEPLCDDMVYGYCLCQSQKVLAQSSR